MKGLVWALYLMVQGPSAGAVAGGHTQMGHSWAYHRRVLPQPYFVHERRGHFY